MRAIVALVLFVAAVSAGPYGFEDSRIIGGNPTAISNYPEMVAVHYAANSVNFGQFCGGSILNQRSVLSAAHCFIGRNFASRWRVRVGSASASSGGQFLAISWNILHPSYNDWTYDSDVAIMRTAATISYVNNAVQAATIAGTNYNLGDNQVVWATGWGVTETGWGTDQLRHVQIWTVSQAVCRQRYGTSRITDNMLCSGWLDVGGRDQCQGDSGGPLYHNRVVVGVCSWGNGCAQARYPGVNARVSRFTTWIQANA